MPSVPCLQGLGRSSTISPSRHEMNETYSADFIQYTWTAVIAPDTVYYAWAE